MASIRTADTGYGKYAVADLQDSVFCGACLVSTVVCAVGAMIIEDIENAVVDQNAKFRQTINRVNKTSVSDNTVKRQNNDMRADQTEKNKSADSETENAKSRKIVNTDPKWIVDESGMVNCPDCGTRMSLDYTKARKKCPDCGCPYKN